MNEKNIKPVKDEVRAVAPQIIVNSPASKRSIDELYRDNPNTEFAYAPAQSTESSLVTMGLAPVIGKDGTPMMVGNKVICKVVSESFSEAHVKAHKLATEQFEEVRNPEETQSADQTAVKRKPVKQKTKAKEQVNE